jgi:hypothetical protein
MIMETHRLAGDGSRVVLPLPHTEEGTVVDGFVGAVRNLVDRANRKAPLVVFVFHDSIIVASPAGLTVTDLNAANFKAMKKVHDQFAAIAPNVSSEELAARLSTIVRVTVIRTDSVVTAFADTVPVFRAVRVHVQTATQGTIVFAGGGPAKRDLAAMLKTVLGPRFTDRTGGPG